MNPSQILLKVAQSVTFWHTGVMNSMVDPDMCLAFQDVHILAIANNDWRDKAVMRTAKQILRAAIQTHLQGKPIKSRELFI